MTGRSNATRRSSAIQRSTSRRSTGRRRGAGDGGNGSVLDNLLQDRDLLLPPEDQ